MPTEQQKKLYKDFWMNALTSLLHWTPDQVKAWGLRWEAGLDNLKYGGFFYHETPIYYIIGLLTPKDLIEKMSSREANELEQEIEKTITLGDITIFQRQDFDWSAAKQRYTEMICKRRATLESTE